MKRNPSLAVLSREHHAALILSRLLQKGAPLYKSLPADVEGKAGYAIQLYNDELVPHFRKEEEALAIADGVSEELDLLIMEIVSEHKDLHTGFLKIKHHPDPVNHLDGLGKQLEGHIRKEERVLFPMMEETCSESMLRQIGDYLSLDRE